MYSVMWSEHCSYKSSKVHLRQFGENVTDEMHEHLMVGMGENAGVVDIGQGYAVTFKIESPGSHLEDRATKPALYARYGIPHYWRIELEPPLVSTYCIGHGDSYQMIGPDRCLSVTEPFELNIAVADLLPLWAGRGGGPTVPEQGS